MTIARLVALAVSLTILFSSVVFSQAVITDMDQTLPTTRETLLPFAFYSDTTDLGVGLGGAMSGYLQSQFYAGAAAFGSTNGSYGFYFIDKDLQLNPIDRLFLDTKIGITEFQESDEYVRGNPKFPANAGTNNSSQQNFVESHTFSAYGEYTFKYVLPIGGRANSPIADYALDRGMLHEGATGGQSFNPLANGRAYVEATPFTYWRELSTDEPIAHGQQNTFGGRLDVRWDNTDFPLNPSVGNSTRISVSRDPGWFSSLSAYTLLEFEHSQYVPLGQSKWFRQQVLALDFWTISTLDGDSPYYAGATLGGYQRLRGYPFYRYHDRDAILGSAELRLMPDWKPTTLNQTIDKLAQIDWMQFVAFGEVGRVGHDYSAGELLSDMKWDAGLGIRMLLRNSVLRVDLAVGDEGPVLWLMVGQSF